MDSLYSINVLAHLAEEKREGACSLCSVWCSLLRAHLGVLAGYRAGVSSASRHGGRQLLGVQRASQSLGGKRL